MDRIVGEGINVEARTNNMREPSDKKVKLCRLKLPNIRYFSYQEGQGMFESVGAWAYVTAISVIRFSDLFTQSTIFRLTLKYWLAYESFQMAPATKLFFHSFF